MAAEPGVGEAGARGDAIGKTRPLTMGDLGRAIGRYTESEGGSSEETLAAHRGLFAIYDEWVDQGRPEVSGFARIRGWMGVEDDEGRVALTQRAEAALTAEPFPVYRADAIGSIGTDV